MAEKKKKGYKKNFNQYFFFRVFLSLVTNVYKVMFVYFEKYKQINNIGFYLFIL